MTTVWSRGLLPRATREVWLEATPVDGVWRIVDRGAAGRPRAADSIVLELVEQSLGFSQLAAMFESRHSTWGVRSAWTKDGEVAMLAEERSLFPPDLRLAIATYIGKENERGSLASSFWPDVPLIVREIGPGQWSARQERVRVGVALAWGASSLVVGALTALALMRCSPRIMRPSAH